MINRAWRFAFAILLGLLSSCGKDGGYGRRPDWKVTLPDGKIVSAADFDSNVVILDFWATWCPPCRKEIPGFIELQKKYTEKGLKIIGFSFDHEKETHDMWIRENGINYLSVFAQTEEGRIITEQFGDIIGEIDSLPTTIVVDRKGRIVYRHLGYGSLETFEKVLQPLF